jgi:sugar (pentulose or hexulose) kinase
MTPVDRTISANAGAAHHSPSGGASPRNVAILDVGKTNAKVTLVSADDATETARRSTANPVVADGLYPHFDVRRLWDFFSDALASLNRDAPIDTISVTGHGSAGAFISDDPDGDGLALPILDYEFPGPDELAAEYDAVRPDFSESRSPRLPAGLNLGAQVFWQERRFPDAFKAAKAYVNYPQYWTWRLSGVAATEMCSMGAHSDMWNPRALRWSSLVETLGWEAKLAPLRSAFDRLGPIRPALARRLGLSPDIIVHCGIHDSSASLLPHLKERTPPFSVVSTGTWVILFTIGGDIDHLDPARDTLANVSAFGDPVACARFMGGREFELLTGGGVAEPRPGDLDRVLAQKIMALPTFVPGTGPFPRGTGRWTLDPDTLSPGKRCVAASLYLALMTAQSLSLVGADGPTVVEGPFARNTLFCSALAAITGRPVEPSDSGTGTMIGALMLATGRVPERRPRRVAAEPLAHPAFAGYAAAWHAAAGTG